MDATNTLVAEMCDQLEELDNKLTQISSVMQYVQTKMEDDPDQTNGTTRYTASILALLRDAVDSSKAQLDDTMQTMLVIRSAANRQPAYDV